MLGLAILGLFSLAAVPMLFGDEAETNSDELDFDDFEDVKEEKLWIPVEFEVCDEDLQQSEMEQDDYNPDIPLKDPNCTSESSEVFDVNSEDTLVLSQEPEGSDDGVQPGGTEQGEPSTDASSEATHEVLSDEGDTFSVETPDGKSRVFAHPVSVIHFDYLDVAQGQTFKLSGCVVFEGLEVPPSEFLQERYASAQISRVLAGEDIELCHGLEGAEIIVAAPLKLDVFSDHEEANLEFGGKPAWETHIYLHS